MVTWFPQHRTLRRAAAVAVLAASCASAQEGDAPAELIDAALSAWTVENAAPGAFVVSDGVLRVTAPEGWLRSTETYGDIRLTAEFRFLTEDADSGIFLRARDRAGEFIRGWPNESYQVQLRNPLGESPFPPVGGIFRHGMPDGETIFEPADAARLSTGTNAWQTLVVEVVGERLTVDLNGERLAEASGIANAAGRIGLQSETGSLEFRSIVVEPLD